MRSGLLVFLVSLLLVVPPALAFVGTGQNIGKNSVKQEDEDLDNSNIAPKPTSAPTNLLNSWKNHGQYVSIIAKDHEDGQDVSEAAKSDIGKKGDEQEGNTEDEENILPDTTVIPTPTPTNVPTITPTSTPTPESITPTVTITPTSIPSNRQITILLSDLDKFFARLEELFNSIVKY